MKSILAGAGCVLVELIAFLFFVSTVSASPLEQPRIINIHVEGSEIVVMTEIQPGIRKVTLESRRRLGGVGWEPRQVARTDGAGGQVQFRLPVSDQLEVLRVRSDETEALPFGFYHGTNSVVPQPANSGGWSGDFSYGVPNWREVDAESPAAMREVVESDIWQIRGDTLYFFNQYRGLQVIDIQNPDAPRLTGSIALPAAGEQMYALESGPLILLTSGNCYYQQGGMDSEVMILTVQAGQPQVAGRVPVAGQIQESRMVGSALYVAAQTFQEVSGSNGTTWEWGTKLSAIDLEDPLAPVARNVLWFPGYNQVVTATDEFFFLATQSEDDWRRSVVHIVDVTDPGGNMVRLGRVKAAGIIADKFKIHVTNDVLTILSEVQGTTLHTMLETFSLADARAPVRLGQLLLGPSERLHATRFAGDKVYVVTFFVPFQMDPLWVVDLSQPEQPRILGELEIPGWSTYLHPWGDRLIACGIETNQTTVSLFDVADPARPLLLKRVALGSGWSWSEANNDEKAFRVLPESGLILLPYQSWDAGTSTTRVQLIDLTTDDLVVRGTIEHAMAPRRATLHRDRVISVSGQELLSADISDRDHPEVIAILELAWPVDWVFLAEDYLIELSRESAWAGVETGPALRLALAAAPDEVKETAALPWPWPALAADARDGKLYVVQGIPWIIPPEDGPLPTDEATPNLALTIYDLTHLPDLPILGSTEVAWDGMGWASEFQVAWPKPGLMLLAGGGNHSWYPWLDWGLRPAGGDVAVSGEWWPYPWGSNGGRLLAFKVEDPQGPSLASEVDLTVEGWWNFSKVSVANGLVYLTHTISEPAPPVVVYDPRLGEWQTNQPPEWVWVQRSFLDVIDYADATEPVVRRPIETPGKLAGVSSHGALIYTVGARWRPHNDWSNDSSEWLDVSAYDGVALHLVDSLQLPTEWPRPLLVEQDVVLLGRVMSNDGGTSAIETWSLGTDGKLSLIADLEPAGAAQVLVNLGGILAAQTNDGILLFDWTDPSQLQPLGGGVLPGCFWPDLGHAAGDALRGIWMPLGYNGVWRLPIGSTF